MSDNTAEFLARVSRFSPFPLSKKLRPISCDIAFPGSHVAVPSEEEGAKRAIKVALGYARKENNFSMSIIFENEVSDNEQKA